LQSVAAVIIYCAVFSFSLKAIATLSVLKFHKVAVQLIFLILPKNFAFD